MTWHERILYLSSKHKGRLEASHVVADAKKKNSPLHHCLEWDDKVCGHKYRIEQARCLIASVRVEVEVVDRGVASTRSIPAFVRDPAVAGNVPGYVSTDLLRRDKDLAVKALRYEAVRADAGFRRCHAVSDALGLSDELNAVIESVGTIRAAVEAG